uniref:Uncharacterized protein n=1 Tax=Physcomitrium patens TaxID=3218 RepID=A0A7I4FJN3_PHYPA
MVLVSGFNIPFMEDVLLTILNSERLQISS